MFHNIKFFQLEKKNKVSVRWYQAAIQTNEQLHKYPGADIDVIHQ